MTNTEIVKQYILEDLSELFIDSVKPELKNYVLNLVYKYGHLEELYTLLSPAKKILPHPWNILPGSAVICIARYDTGLPKPLKRKIGKAMVIKQHDINPELVKIKYLAKFKRKAIVTSWVTKHSCTPYLK